MNIEQNVYCENRDTDIENNLLNRYYNAFVDSYISNIEKLNSVPDFIRDDSFNGIKSSEHIIYKLRINKQGDTVIMSNDKNRGYEFVIEFDKKDSAYGIYYGCKGLIKGENIEKEIIAFSDEWDKIKNEATLVLNNTFPGKNFLKRYKLTNNVNNKTFWPFWIPLYEEEDIIEVAARAVRIIYNIYKRMIDGLKCNDKIDNNKLRLSNHTKTDYTTDAYNLILSELSLEAQRFFKNFLDNGTKMGYFEVDDRYEKCWRVKTMKNVEVFHLIKSFCEKLTNIDPKSGKWKLFQPILLSSKGTPIDLRKSNNTTSMTNKEGKSRDHEANTRVEEILKYHNK